MYKVLIPFNNSHVCEMQKWCQDNNIKHKPTEKSVDDGYIFSFYDEKSAIAFKLAWR